MKTQMKTKKIILYGKSTTTATTDFTTNMILKT